MLGWLAVAAAPLVIHLLTRRRYREEPWAAMEFLLAAMRKAAKRMRIEQLLLLIVRTLIIVLIVLAVSQLRWTSSSRSAAGDQPALKVLVLDRSFSMAYTADDQMRFERAKTAAIRRIEEGKPGDAFLVVLMGEPPLVVVEEPAFYPADTVVRELRDPVAISIEHRGADLAATLAKAEELIEHNLERVGRFATAEVHVFSDMSRNTWSGVSRDSQEPEATKSEGLAQRIAKIREITGDRIYVVDVGQPSSENVAVTGVHVAAPYATVGRPVRIEAKVTNFGSQPQRALPVEVFIDGERIKRFDSDVLAWQEVSLPALEHTFDTPGDHLVEVRAGEDLLAVDNHRWEAIRVEPSLRVLCVNGKPDSDPLRDGAQHLAMALSALDQPDRPPRIQTRTILETELLSTDINLSDYHAVILSNVSRINPEEARLLRSYVERGGAAIFFLGDQVRGDSYNRTLTSEDAATSLLPARIGDVQKTALQGLDLAKYENPIASYFRSQRGPGLSRPLIGNYHKLVIAEDSDTRRLIDFADGQPAIVARDVGLGRSVMVATTAAVDPAGDSVWSAMPYEKLYVPLIHKILEAAVEGQLSSRTVRAGQSLTHSPRTGVPKIGYRLDFAEALAEVPRKLADGEYNLDRQGGQWIYADTNRAGVYRLHLKAPLDQQAQFAVNVDTRESDLTRIADEEMSDGLAILKIGEDIDASVVVDSPLRLDPAHASLLGAALVLLLVDSVLAWRISHRSL